MGWERPWHGWVWLYQGGPWPREDEKGPQSEQMAEQIPLSEWALWPGPGPSFGQRTEQGLYSDLVIDQDLCFEVPYSELRVVMDPQFGKVVDLDPYFGNRVGQSPWFEGELGWAPSYEGQVQHVSQERQGHLLGDPVVSVVVEDLWAQALKADLALSAEVVVDWLWQVAGGIPKAVQQELQRLPGFLTEPSASGSSSTAILSSKRQAQREKEKELSQCHLDPIETIEMVSNLSTVASTLKFTLRNLNQKVVALKAVMGC